MLFREELRAGLRALPVGAELRRKGPGPPAPPRRLRFSRSLTSVVLSDFAIPTAVTDTHNESGLEETGGRSRSGRPWQLVLAGRLPPTGTKPETWVCAPRGSERPFQAQEY